MSTASATLMASASAQTTMQMPGEPDHAQGHAADHASHNHEKPKRPEVPRLPALLCRNTRTEGIDAAYSLLKQGGDTLDACLSLTRTQENDANDASAGLGGLPDEEGNVQLDACCFHGPTRRASAVASVGGIRNPSLLARAVMEKTGYSLLSGADAQRFALAQKFSTEDLTTERSRKVWAVWKQLQSVPQPWSAGVYDPKWSGSANRARFLPASQKDLDVLVRRIEPLAVEAGLGPQWTWRAAFDSLFPAANPLYVASVNEKHELSSAATTSGLPWRMPGATSDIAVVGAGTYLDPEVGSAGASGNAEANIKIGGARLIVENMRRGMSPDKAGMDALHRIVEWYGNDMTALRFVEMVYYILRKDGAYSCVSLWHGDRTGHEQQFTIHDGVRRSEECLFLLEGNPPNGVSRAMEADT